jgi:outer membrane protein TolC
MTAAADLADPRAHNLARSAVSSLTLLLSALLLAGPVRAQEGAVLTLQGALERARQYNPDYRIAENDLELSRAGKKEAWGAFLPNLSLSASSGLTYNRQLVSTDNFGNPIENPITEWQTSSSSSQYLGGSVTLFEGGQRFQDLSVQSAQARAREATVASRLRSLRAEVIRIYHRAQAQQATLTVEEGLLEGRRTDLELTRRMFDLAGATRVEVLAAELNLQRQEQRIQQTLAQFQQGLLSLRSTIGDPDLGQFGLSEELPGTFDPETLDEEELVARALASSPLVLQQSAQMEVSAAQVKAARGSRWPSLSMSFGFNQRTFALERDALFDMWPDQGRYGSTSFSLSIPIFSRFQTSARIAESQVAADNAQENLRRTRLQIEEDVRSRLIALRTAYQGYQIALLSREIAQERLNLAREQFRLGSRTFNELQRDIDDAASAEREVITQLFGFVENRANLEEAVGELNVGAENGGASGGSGEEAGPPSGQEG